jgi:ArsR family transcriptional regulator, arsenate/arsenite/antimonite-responsive transcriptional repressor
MVTLTTHSLTAENHPTGVPNEVPALGNLGDDTVNDLVQLFKLLADDTRLKVIHFLMQKDELNVRTLCKLLRQSQPAVSHHLALLRDAGVIECRREGKHNYYHLVPKRCQALLDTVFGVSGGQGRKIRVENAVLSYSHDAMSA